MTLGNLKMGKFPFTSGAGNLFVFVGHIQAQQGSSGPPPTLKEGQLQN